MASTQLGMKDIAADVVLDPPPKIVIRQDSDPESPRQWDNLGTMVCWHRRYNLGDGREGKRAAHMSFEPKDWFDEHIPKGSVVLPLYLYDHSGITMSTGSFSCPWDSGQVGWIYVTPERIRKEFSCKRITKKRREMVEAILKQEVKTYDHYLTNNVWGYECGDDSCWGFYGDNLEETGLADNFPGRAEAVAAAWDTRL